MDQQKILHSVADGVGRIVFNNPERRNAVSLDMWETVEAVLDDYAANDEVRVVVVSGAGDKAFVSGADISKFESERADEASVKRYNDTTGRVYRKLHNFPKPTIAEITGVCVGGGVALAICCDMRICGEGSRFAIPAAKLGLGYGYNGLERLVQLVGPSHAKEIFFTARLFSSAEAREMGLVNRAVPDGLVTAYVDDYARKITANAPLTVASVKFIVNQTLKDPADRDMKACEDMVARCFASRDYEEGRRAFMEKRKPKFVGA